MKTFIAMFAVSLISAAAFSQNTESLLKYYLNVKDALIKSDHKMAHEHAATLEKAVVANNIFDERESLLKAIQKMVKATDIEKQRVAFADVSVIMWKIVKKSNEINEVIYYEYCPMKQSFWLSKDEVIRNPYYGSKMINCGKVSDKKEK